MSPAANAAMPVQPAADAAQEAPADLNAQSQSEAALAEAIEENEAIRRILGGLILPGEPLARPSDVQTPAQASTMDGGVMEAAFVASEPYGPGSTAAPRGGRPGMATSGPITIDDEGAAVGGLTLGQVLHSIAARPRQSTATAGPLAQQGAEGLDDESIEEDTDGSDAASLALRERLLKSRLLGLALESIIQISPLDTSFSIFGLGRFEVELTPGEQGATVTEASSNISITLGPGRQSGDYPERAQRDSERMSIIALLQGFFGSPAGFLSMIGAATLLLIWGMLRLATSLRRSAIARGGR